MESILCIFILSLLGLSFAEYDMCAQGDLSSDIGVTLSIYRDAYNSMARFEISADSTAWFAYGIGGNVMNGTYAVIGYGDTFTVEERVLGQSGTADALGRLITTNNERSTDDSGGMRTITIDVPYGMTKGLESFLMCQTEDFEMDVIAAHGLDNTFPDYHGYGNGVAGTVMNVCCMEMSSTNYVATDLTDSGDYVVTDLTEDIGDDTSTTEEKRETTDEGPDGIGQMKYIWNVVCVAFMAFIIIR